MGVWGRGGGCPLEQGIFFKFQVYKEVGISPGLVEVYKIIIKSVISAAKGPKRANRCILWSLRLVYKLFAGGKVIKLAIFQFSLTFVVVFVVVRKLPGLVIFSQLKGLCHGSPVQSL